MYLHNKATQTNTGRRTAAWKAARGLKPYVTLSGRSSLNLAPDHRCFPWRLRCMCEVGGIFLGWLVRVGRLQIWCLRAMRRIWYVPNIFITQHWLTWILELFLFWYSQCGQGCLYVSGRHARIIYYCGTLQAYSSIPCMHTLTDILVFSLRFWFCYKVNATHCSMSS